MKLKLTKIKGLEQLKNEKSPPAPGKYCHVKCGTHAVVLSSTISLGNKLVQFNQFVIDKGSTKARTISRLEKVQFRGIGLLEHNYFYFFRIHIVNLQLHCRKKEDSIRIALGNAGLFSQTFAHGNSNNEIRKSNRRRMQQYD